MAKRESEAPSESKEKQWYSIREAAEFLSVSEPTIYRWMKDQTLSFYKIGSSTRFSRDGLDAVIEKTTGRKEAEASAGRCASCGHSILLDGRLQGTGRLYFRPDKTKFTPKYVNSTAANPMMEIQAARFPRQPRMKRQCRNSA